jgi:hypothetical protein
VIQILREVSFYSQRSLGSAAVPAAEPAPSEAEGMATLQKAAELRRDGSKTRPYTHESVLHLIGLVVVLVGFVDGEAGEIVSHF